MMITKFKLILSFTVALLILSFFIWVYSLTERLEGEKEKRAEAEDKAEVALIERDVALAISEEQSQLAQQQSWQADFLETSLKEIEDAAKSPCDLSPATHAVINRLWQ